MTLKIMLLQNWSKGKISNKFLMERSMDFEPDAPNREVDLEAMAKNFFAYANEIHQEFSEGEDSGLDFNDMFKEEDDID